MGVIGMVGEQGFCGAVAGLIDIMVVRCWIMSFTHLDLRTSQEERRLEDKYWRRQRSGMSNDRTKQRLKAWPATIQAN